MKATGIIRRVDDLGRVVIPKEIRKNLKIKDGDALEIFIDKGQVIFQKYNNIDWEFIGNVLSGSILADVPFALYDSNFDVTFRTNSMFADDGSTIEADFIRTIGNYGYIAFCDDDYSQSSMVVNLIEKLIQG